MNDEIIEPSPLDVPCEEFAEAIDRRSKNRNRLLLWINDNLEDKIDFGALYLKKINQWTKPSLFKPGAEKVCLVMNVQPYFPSLHEYEAAALSGLALERVVLSCELRNPAGKTLAYGVGARDLETDYNDMNKSLKMAAKSAMIDATLRLAGLSDVFSQDLEDMGAEKLQGKPERFSGPVKSCQELSEDIKGAKTVEALRAWYRDNLNSINSMGTPDREKINKKCQDHKAALLGQQSDEDTVPVTQDQPKAKEPTIQDTVPVTQDQPKDKEPLTEELIKRIDAILAETGVDSSAVAKALKLEQISDADASRFPEILSVIVAEKKKGSGPEGIEKARDELAAEYIKKAKSAVR